MTFDRRVGLSHDTGQVTHHIAPDIDAERDGLMRDLRAAAADRAEGSSLARRHQCNRPIVVAG